MEPMETNTCASDTTHSTEEHTNTHSTGEHTNTHPTGVDTATHATGVDTATYSTGAETNTSFAGVGERVEHFSKVLKTQHDVIYRHENISKYFPADIARVVEKSWAQVHPHISGATEAKYQRLLEEFGVVEQLSRLDRLKSEHDPAHPAWRPSGIPSNDYNTSACAEDVKYITDFEEKLTEVQSQTHELEELLKERQKELQDLETHIKTSLHSLSSQFPASIIVEDGQT